MAHKGDCMLTDEMVDRICAYVQDEFVSIRQACDLVGVGYTAFRMWAVGDSARNTKWREKYLKAKQMAVVHWLQTASQYAADNNNAGVKHCHNMLMALDPDRFRVDKSNGKAAITVNIIQGGKEPVTLPEIEVLEGAEPALLGEG